ncbi:hypothetical protein [Leptodesmis sichuanensis]|uniref:hypothetical protein n=1 Tax=Leptodesmis sichuanensis TaxID=2906798 RepID=UPI001F25DB1A|nr:hypothetical protein [Leptodesmis sichuanensis]
MASASPGEKLHKVRQSSTIAQIPRLRNAEKWALERKRGSEVMAQLKKILSQNSERASFSDRARNPN